MTFYILSVFFAWNDGEVYEKGKGTHCVAYWSWHASTECISGRNSRTEESHPLSLRLSYSAALFFPNQQLITIVIMIEKGRDRERGSALSTKALQ
mgnify:CR=1 FL=1